MIPVLGAIVPVLGKLLEKVIPDPAAREQAEREMLKLQQNGELDAIQVQLSAIIAEAQSADPWTSRARPSFLYVVYVVILASIPMGVLHAFQPETAAAIATGFRAWLEGIPEEMWWLFGAGYLGYTGARTVEKKSGKAR